MKRFVEGKDRRRTTLLPECVDDHVAEENPVRAVEAFVDALDLPALGFEGAVPGTTGRPAYHPATLLKIYLYGYLNRIQSSRRLEREAGRTERPAVRAAVDVDYAERLASFLVARGSHLSRLVAQGPVAPASGPMRPEACRAGLTRSVPAGASPPSGGERRLVAVVRRPDALPSHARRLT